jgi:predicted transcriptional regulator of viral defense system
LGVSALELVAAASSSKHLVTGGTALSEAGLSDQSFRTLTALVASEIRGWKWQGVEVRYFTVPEPEIWGADIRHLGRFSLNLARPERAILDSLSRPGLGVPLAQVVEALDIALARAGDFAETLARAAARYGGPFLARRLGFIVERLAGPVAATAFTALIGRSRRTTLLLPGGPAAGPIDARWRVMENVDFDLLTNHRVGG